LGTAVELKDLKSVKNMFSLEGKKAFVTGGAGGIGRSTAAAMAELGADVALVDIKLDVAQQNAEYIAQKYGVKTMALACDVSDPVAVKEMVTKIIKQFGTIDAVHSNAGIVANDDTVDISYESWQRMIDINLNGMFLINQTVGQWLRDNHRTGSIINTASMSGHIINRVYGEDKHMLAYNTSKFGVVGLTKAMAMGFVKDGIRFNSISPGYMFSGIHDTMDPARIKTWENDIPMGRFGTMDEIGGLVAFLASDISSYMTGADVIIDGGHTVW